MEEFKREIEEQSKKIQELIDQGNAVSEVDKRMLAIARTQLQIGFMALRKATGNANLM